MWSEAAAWGTLCKILPSPIAEWYSSRMDRIAEIEAAIENLPAREVDQLAQWLQTLRQKRSLPLPIENWLQQARGAALPGVRTHDVMKLTRGEE